MNLSVSRERVHNFVLDVCRQNKVDCLWHFSENTNSLYYRIFKDDAWLSFRISDHAKKQRTLPSITVGKSTNFPQIGKFVQNRIDCLKGLAAHRLFSEFMRKSGAADRRGEFGGSSIGGVGYGMAW